MSIYRAIILITLLAVEVSAQDVVQRTWVSSNGKSRLTATLVEIKPKSGAPTSVILKRSNGRNLEVELSKLSTKDQEFVKQMRMKEEESAAARRNAWRDKLLKASEHDIIIAYIWGDWMGDDLAEDLIHQFTSFADRMRLAARKQNREIRFVLINIDDEPLAKRYIAAVGKAKVKIVVGRTPTKSRDEFFQLIGGAFPAIGIWQRDQFKPKYANNTGNVKYEEDPFREQMLVAQEALINDCSRQLDDIFKALKRAGGRRR